MGCNEGKLKKRRGDVVLKQEEGNRGKAEMG